MWTLVTFLLLTVSFSQASDLRTWFLEKGLSFKASYVGAKDGRVTLANEGGKQALFFIKELSLVDRYYLHEEKGLPLEELVGKNDYNPEYLYEPKRVEMEKGPKYKVRGDGYNIQLSSLLTPHFLLFHERDLEIEEMGLVLEKVWYSHAYRSPHFIDLYGEKRKVYFYIHSEETLNAFGQYHADSLGEDATQLEINSVIQRWDGIAFDTPFPIPAEIMKEFKTEEEGMIQQDYNSGESYMKAHTLTAPFYKWQALYLPGASLPQHRNSSTEKTRISAQGFLSMVLASEIRLNGNENKALVGLSESSLSLKYPPQGKPARWGKDLVTAIQEKEVECSVKMIYDVDALSRSEGSKERNLKKMYLFMAIGRFLQKDLAHMISYCRLTDYISSEGHFPSDEKLVELYGYQSVYDFDEALTAFIMKENKGH